MFAYLFECLVGWLYYHHGPGDFDFLPIKAGIDSFVFDKYIFCQSMEEKRYMEAWLQLKLILYNVGFDVWKVKPIQYIERRIIARKR